MDEVSEDNCEKEKFLQPKVEVSTVNKTFKEKDKDLSISESIEMDKVGEDTVLRLLNGNPNSSGNDNSSPVEKSEDEESPENCAWKKYAGLILTLLSTFVFSINQVVTKILTKEMHPFNMGMWIFSISSILALPFLVYRKMIKKKSSLDVLLPVKDHLKLVSMMVIRAVISPVAFILFFYAFENLELGDAVVIVSAAPVFVYLLGWLFLGEKMGLIIILASVLAVAGVIVIVRPPILSGRETFDEKLLVGISFAVLSMLSMSISFVIVRFLKGVYHGLLTVISNTSGALFSIVLALTFGVFQWPQSNYQVLLFLSISFLSFLGQTLLILALRFEQAGPVSLLRTCGVILAFLWQFFFFGKIPDNLCMVGAGMIVTGVVIIILRKWLYDLPKENKFRKRFAILLV